MEVDFGVRVYPLGLEPVLRAAVLGPQDGTWTPPSWLKQHQVNGVRRVLASLRVFHGALLADAVGLGKTYEALAVAAVYDAALAVVPAALRSQWIRVSKELGVKIRLLTHEALSRGRRVPEFPLIIVDEAHRLRNQKTRRYDALARGVKSSHLLLLTATPVVNSGTDIVNLLRLFATDHSFALLGLPSLERALLRREYQDIAYATAPVVIARSAQNIGALQHELPKISDRHIIRPLPLPAKQLRPLLRTIDQLSFPSLNDSPESSLLRLHLLYRLASSPAAFRDTVRKHLLFVERALDASHRGETLSRATARLLFPSEDELQLGLDDLPGSATSLQLDPSVLEQEQHRLRHVLQVLASVNGQAPKAAALSDILIARNGCKTIVFTCAVATALDLARKLSWQKLAVVGAGRAWIASGPIQFDEALNLFAPKARKANRPPRAARVTTLIATDVASEGLDLQDADAVIHYDLPWTPLRLEQRVGRIARLGSDHRAVEVQWFAPPRSIERRLGVEARIARKVQCQLGLSVATTSRVGRASIVNDVLDRRETLGVNAVQTPYAKPCHAVVRGPLSAAIALQWISGEKTIPELVILAGDPPAPVYDYATAEQLVSRLAHADSSAVDPPKPLTAALDRLIRKRLAGTTRGPTNQANRRLARMIVRRAFAAGRRRDTRTLSLLDVLLDRVGGGLATGAERELGDILRESVSQSRVSHWLHRHPATASSLPRIKILNAIFGDGTVDQPMTKRRPR